MADCRGASSIAAILFIVVTAVMLFNVVFLILAHQAGLFRVSVGPEKIARPVTNLDAQEVVRLVEEQRAVIEQRRQEVEQEAARLADLKQQLDVEKNNLEAQRKKMNGLLEELNGAFGKRDAAAEQRLLQMSKMYDTMKPDQVAAIFEKLDDATVIDILLKMKMKNSARVLGKMKPARASMLSAHMRMIQQPAGR
ncbi:MAG: hypothetical protein NC924_02240 [Candidatus Omnitrophica bacterium]|nr:hypothetical protein [Candidatus Omnitrophota bacterium]